MNKFWGFISIYLFIPVYIDYLGVEAYGVISFYSVILGIVSIVDAGMSSSVTREFASNDTNYYKFNILDIIERYFFMMCLGVCILLIVLAPQIAKIWLYTEGRDNSFIVRLIAIGVCLQLFSTIYYSGLMGLNKQVLANSIQLSWGIAKTFGVLLLFILVGANLEIFFYCQITVNIILVIVLRYSLVKKLALQKDKYVRQFSKLPNPVQKYIFGMIFIAIISAINIYTDKLVISSYFSLKDFGIYSIASNLAQLPVLVGTPIALSFFPIFSRLYSENSNEALNTTFSSVSFLFNIIIIPLVTVIFLNADEILRIWVGSNLDNAELPLLTYLVKFLAIGGAFLSLQIIPYYFLLANGETKYTIYQGCCQILIGIPLLYICVTKYGVQGIPLPWMIINLGAFLFLNIVVGRKYLKKSFPRELFRTIALPAAISITIVTAVVAILNYFSFHVAISSAVAILLALVLNIIMSNLLNGYRLLDVKSIFKF
ncbi:oligosaccharide flippase family protein [Sphingobacterium deserti]|nr:oligosaccharide flippase family protein [Sphingobacterium deserti]